MVYTSRLIENYEILIKDSKLTNDAKRATTTPIVSFEGRLRIIQKDFNELILLKFIKNTDANNNYWLQRII